MKTAFTTSAILVVILVVSVAIACASNLATDEATPTLQILGQVGEAQFNQRYEDDRELWHSTYNGRSFKYVGTIQRMVFNNEGLVYMEFKPVGDKSVRCMTWRDGNYTLSLEEALAFEQGEEVAVEGEFGAISRTFNPCRVIQN